MHLQDKATIISKLTRGLEILQIKRTSVETFENASENITSYIRERKENIEEKVVSKILEGIEIYVPLGALVDTEKELARLKGELDKVESEIKTNEEKLDSLNDEIKIINRRSHFIGLCIVCTMKILRNSVPN